MNSSPYKRHEIILGYGDQIHVDEFVLAIPRRCGCDIIFGGCVVNCSSTMLQLVLFLCRGHFMSNNITLTPGTNNIHEPVSVLLTRLTWIYLFPPTDTIVIIYIVSSNNISYKRSRSS